VSPAERSSPQEMHHMRGEARPLNGLRTVAGSTTVRIGAVELTDAAATAGSSPLGVVGEASRAATIANVPTTPPATNRARRARVCLVFLTDSSPQTSDGGQ